MPGDTITHAAAGIDFTTRVASSATVIGSPALAAETLIVQLALPLDGVKTSEILLYGWVAFTVGTSGTAATIRVRRASTLGSLGGLVQATTGALTVTAANLVAFSVSGADNSQLGPFYSLSLQVTAGAAVSTVTAAQLTVINV